jgi:hypothetical protein
MRVICFIESTLSLSISQARYLQLGLAHVHPQHAHHGAQLTLGDEAGAVLVKVVERLAHVRQVRLGDLALRSRRQSTRALQPLERDVEALPPRPPSVRRHQTRTPRTHRRGSASLTLLKCASGMQPTGSAS